MRRNPSHVMPADERTDAARKPIRNKILLAMSVAFQRIRPHLEPVALPAHFSLHEPHHTYRFAYSPNEGLISLVIVMANGRTVEAGIVGHEGVAGLPAIVGLNRSPLREVMQTLEEMKDELERQRDTAFASHVCAEHPRTKTRPAPG